MIWFDLGQIVMHVGVKKGPQSYSRIKTKRLGKHTETAMVSWSRLGLIWDRSGTPEWHQTDSRNASDTETVVCHEIIVLS